MHTRALAIAALAAGVVAVGLVARTTGPVRVHADAPPASQPQADTPPPGPAATAFRPPSPPGAAERADERAAMVQQQLAQPRDGRTPVRDARVLAAMRAAPRHAFVPAGRRGAAYRDYPLPIGHGQTISQPYIVGLMTELLRLEPTSRVLEIGTGSGYQAAVLAHLTPHVHSIEIVEPLARSARAALDTQGYHTVRTRAADGYHGWPEAAPFDVIIVTCAAGHLPPPLWAQLAPGGRIVIPIGSPHEVQRLVLVEKQVDGSRRSRTILDVRFVPLTRGSAR